MKMEQFAQSLEKYGINAVTHHLDLPIESEPIYNTLHADLYRMR